MVVAHLRVCYFYTQNQPPGVPYERVLSAAFLRPSFGLIEKGDVVYESDWIRFIFDRKQDIGGNRKWI